MVYASVSGGIDSTVMYHLIHEEHPDVPAYFVNTRMEFPEIVRFVKTLPNVTQIIPDITPTEIFQKYGYPVVSKDISRSLRYARAGSNWALRRFDGQRPDGTASKWYAQRYVKWKYLLEADFPISDACCHELKVKPLQVIERNRKPFIGMMAYDSERRAASYMKTGCNAYNSKMPRSMPLGIWTTQDVLRYIRENDIPYAREVYGEIIEDKNGHLSTTLEQRTGCYACPLGQCIRRKRGTESRYER